MIVKLPNSDLYGLVEWYGKRSRAGRKGGSSTDAAAGTDTEVDGDVNDTVETQTGEKAAA